MNHRTRKRTIRLIPSVRPGNGTGHLRRCLETAKSLEENHDADARILIESAGPTLSAVDTILEAYPSGKLPPIDQITLRDPKSLEPFLKEPGSKGWKSVYELPIMGPFQKA